MRRQGKLLAFASVRERPATSRPATSSPATSRPAAAAAVSGARAGRPCVEQLIAGKALVAAAGEERAAALLRHIKPGAVFVARLGWGSPTTLTLTLALALTPALTLALILAPTLPLTLSLTLTLT